MSELLKGLQLIKTSVNVKPKSVITENLIFKFHYRLTFWILLVATLLVCSREYVGEHIRCLRGGKYLPEKPVETYCFFTATFTVVKNLNKSFVSENIVPHPGVGPIDADKDDTITHAYYQWVPFFLFFQALCFYMPHYVWKQFEGGRMLALCTGINLLDILDMEKKTNKIETIKQAFHKRLHVNRPWAQYMVLCEFLNFVNLGCQIALTDWFLGWKFFSLGPRVMTYHNNDVYPLDEVFPKVTKCHFYKYGASGSLQLHDILCVMALNVINEKIFVFLWFWFLFLYIITVIGLLWRLISFLFHRRLLGLNRLVFQTASSVRLDPVDLEIVCKNTDFRDWLFLTYIAFNLNGRLFQEVLKAIAQDLNENESDYVNKDEVARIAFEYGSKSTLSSAPGSKSLGKNVDYESS